MATSPSSVITARSPPVFRKQLMPHAARSGRRPSASTTPGPARRKTATSPSLEMMTQGRTSGQTIPRPTSTSPRRPHARRARRCHRAGSASPSRRCCRRPDTRCSWSRSRRRTGGCVLPHLRQARHADARDGRRRRPCRAVVDARSLPAPQAIRKRPPELVNCVKLQFVGVRPVTSAAPTAPGKVTSKMPFVPARRWRSRAGARRHCSP